jgi:stalled ribosome rescue protein Dom34
VITLKTKKTHKRGYPVAILAGLEEDHAVLWKIFSNVVKHEKNLALDGNRTDSKALYNFHESIINALRPTLKEGIKSIIVASPSRTNYAQEFSTHVREHHAWLTQGSNTAVFSEITGSASSPSQVAELARTPSFRRLIRDTTAEETENLIEILEQRLNATSKNNLVLFSLEEAEKLILGTPKADRPKPEYLLLTQNYLASSREKNRLHRLMQIATNRKVKTRIVDAKSAAGQRLTQFGGIVCLARLE